MKKYILLVFSLGICITTMAQKESKNVNRGNRFYEKEKYIDAEIEYRKGLEKNNNSFSGAFNLGNSLYRQEKYPEAAEQYQQALSKIKNEDKSKKAATYHNIGNSLLKAYKQVPDSMKSKTLAGSIESYKQALRNNPSDDDTRSNLAYAQQLLQQQQQQQQNNKDQNKEQNKEQKNQQQPENKKEDQKDQQKQDPNKMSKENAEQILDAIMQDEKGVQEKVKQQQTQQSKRYRVSKDW